MPLTLSEFMASREPWLDVLVIDGPQGGNRYAVVISIDGFYSDRAEAEALADDYKNDLREAGVQLGSKLRWET